jgi:hypothetical protein
MFEPRDALSEDPLEPIVGAAGQSSLAKKTVNKDAPFRSTLLQTKRSAQWSKNQTYEK